MRGGGFAQNIIPPGDPVLSTVFLRVGPCCWQYVVSIWVLVTSQRFAAPQAIARRLRAQRSSLKAPEMKRYRSTAPMFLCVRLPPCIALTGAPSRREVARFPRSWRATHQCRGGGSDVKAVLRNANAGVSQKFTRRLGHRRRASGKLPGDPPNRHRVCAAAAGGHPPFSLPPDPRLCVRTTAPLATKPQSRLPRL